MEVQIDVLGLEREAAKVKMAWSEYRLKYLARNIVDKVASDDSYKPFVGLERISSWTGIIDSSADNKKIETLGNLFYPGDILFGKLRPYLAKVALSDFYGHCSSELLVLRPLSNVIPSFLRYRLVEAGMINTVNASTYGAKMPRASWEFIGNLKVAIPQPSIQKIIADFLDCETTRIDQLIEKKQRLEKLADEKRFALIKAAVTGKIDTKTGKVKAGSKSSDDAKFRDYGDIGTRDRRTGRIFDCFPHAEVLSIPKVRLGLKARIFSGGTPDKSNLEFWEKGEFPWVGSGEVNQNHIIVPTAYITAEAVQNSATKLFPAGSLAMALAGQGKTRATVATMGINAYGNQSLACIADCSGDSKFLYWWLSSLYDEIRSLSSQDTRDGLNQSMVGQIPVPDYDNKTQKAIADFLDRETACIDALKTKTLVSIERLREYRSALVTAAVTGQIDVATWSRRRQTDRSLDTIEATQA